MVGDQKFEKAMSDFFNNRCVLVCRLAQKRISHFAHAWLMPKNMCCGIACGKGLGGVLCLRTFLL
jgi:hypothetical protein